MTKRSQDYLVEYFRKDINVLQNWRVTAYSEKDAVRKFRKASGRKTYTRVIPLNRMNIFMK